VKKGKCRAAARSCGKRTMAKGAGQGRKKEVPKGEEWQRNNAQGEGAERGQKRVIATGRKSEKEEVLLREILRKGKCHRRRSKKGTVQKAEKVRR
jgi:hypothetical protein